MPVSACVCHDVLLQLTFSNGKPKGFAASAFDWSKSEFSKFFNLKRVKTESEFYQAWEKFISPSLCPDTGVFSVVKAGALADPTEKQQVRCSKILVRCFRILIRCIRIL